MSGRVEYDALPEKTPGDYYENKRREAKAVQAELTKHEQDCTLYNCRRCKVLQKQLELARYVGD